jgi:hypothetical protein
MCILSLEEGFSLVEKSQRDKIKPGVIITQQEVDMFGVDTEFYRLEVLNKPVAPLKWFQVFICTLYAIPFGGKVVAAYSCKNLSTGKEVVIIMVLCKDSTGELYHNFVI